MEELIKMQREKINELIDFKNKVAFGVAMYLLKKYTIEELIAWLMIDEELNNQIIAQINLEKK